MFRRKCDKLAYVTLALAVIVIVIGFFYMQTMICSDKIINVQVVHSENNVIKDNKIFKISTDKKIYQAGEPVIIHVINNTTKPMMQDASSSVYIKTNRYLGKNIGVGVIEKKENTNWLAVEALWRCPGSCNKECESIPPIRPNENKTFIWDQLLMVCSVEATSTEKIYAGSGLYRIVSIIKNQKGENEKLYSNEFKILEKLDFN